jgi:hypothetical protein
VILRLFTMLTRIYSGFRGMTFEALSDNLATAKTQRLPVVEPPALPGIKRKSEDERARQDFAARHRSAEVSSNNRPPHEPQSGSWHIFTTLNALREPNDA